MKSLLLIFVLSVQLNGLCQVKDGTVYTWDATIGKQTKAWIWFEQKDSVIIGEITYQKTKKPIKLRGTYSRENGFRLLEFESSGNITGIITGKVKDSSFSGHWFSPKTRNELPLTLKLKVASLHTALSLKRQQYTRVYTDIAIAKRDTRDIFP